ncbi:MAG: helix-turn-helix transcriptional regulator [Gammaproteobacteria bacterium]|nr:helix-turn-helix transcriptional regulator [Gammaproteobacteria bacterium]
MGLMDIPLDNYSGNRGFGQYANPPAYHIPYVQEEIERTYSLYRGSGSTVASILIVSFSGANTQVIQNSQNKFATAVNEICSAFGLTMEELAQVCHIQSRKTLYNWIKGEASPRKSTMRRMFDLLTVAQAWKHAGFSGDKALLHQPVIGDENLFDILNRQKIDKELVLFVGSRLNLLSPTKGNISDPFA